MTNNPNAITPQAPKALTPLENFKLFIRREDIMQRFEDMLGDRYAKPFVNDVMVAVANNPKLLECTHASLVKAALDSASLSLSVNPTTGQAYLVPYGKIAKFIAGWKGLRDMAYATNQVRILHVGELYEGEYLEEDRITGTVEMQGGKISNKVHSLFCTLVLYNGFKKTIYRTLDEIHAHAKSFNPAGYNHPQGPWKSDKPRTVRGMEKKTILREMIMHWVPLDPYKKQLLRSIDETDYRDMDVIEAEFKDDPLAQRAKESETEDDLLSSLGYETENVSRETPPPPAVEETYPAPLEMALSEVDGRGKLLSEYSTDKLIEFVQKAQEKLATTKDDEEIVKLQFKRDAASTIIMHRANHPEVK